MARFQAAQPTGVAVAQLEVLVRAAVFKTANELVGWMLQQAVDRIDAAYQPKPGEERKGRENINAQGIFGHFPLNRDYYYHPGKKQGHYPADAALGLEVGYTPALAKLLLLRQEGLRRGMATAKNIVLLVDGANGLKNMGKQNFKGCVQIVDFFHAMEHAGLVLEELIGKDQPDYKRRLRCWAKRLLKDKVQALIKETRKECAGKACAAAVEKALHYFVTNVSRMQYGTFRAAGYFIGSGVVEAGCKTVIGGRCKQSGMFWSEPGAENILALRCIHSSRRLDKFWKERLNAKLATNDCLPLAA